jgi:hypothetical protein
MEKKMSLLHDPFDLIKTGQDMDNVKPFIAQNKVDAMIDIALAQRQYTAQKPKHVSIWKFSGLAAVACMALFMVFLSPTPSPSLQQAQISVSEVSPELASDDAGEFTELVMLDTWERY